ncbi:beta-ketoacyl synthase N-terminal-like domain-containing protein [Peribacillus simplex]|uniref:beta-ketoacyl synthase N-terminal-like domain-containing protein n=1 Tax=Peribacillus simplex TaxID=1478 RepID=UPI003D27ABC8
MNIIGVGKVLPREISADSIKSGIEIEGIYEPEDFDIKKYIKYKGLRSLTKATNLAIASVSEAIKDAGEKYELHSSERIGVFVGSTLNPTDAAFHFMSDVYEASADFVSPLKFSSSVLNSISGWTSIVFGITGLNSTVISGNLSGIDALKMATTYINNDVIDIAIVTAVEGNEEGSIYHMGNNSHSINAIAGAITVIIEKNEGHAAINKIHSFQHYEKNREKIIFNLEQELKIGKYKNIIYGSTNSNDELISEYLRDNMSTQDINIINTSKSIGTSNSLSGFLKLITSLDLEGETLIIETNEVGNDSILKINSGNKEDLI